MFKGLRDYYVREKKKLEKRSGGAGDPVDSSLGLFKPLHFLKDTVKHRTTSGNFVKTKSSSEISSETTALTEQSTSSSGEQPKVSRERDHDSSASGSEFEAEDAGEVLIASSTPQSTARAGTNFLAFDSDDDDNDDIFVKDQSESKGKPANTRHRELQHHWRTKCGKEGMRRRWKAKEEEANFSGPRQRTRCRHSVP